MAYTPNLPRSLTDSRLLNSAATIARLFTLHRCITQTMVEGNYLLLRCPNLEKGEEKARGLSGPESEHPGAKEFR